ncbi:amidohydrolase family protein [Microbacterium sp. 4R-513]|uniref:amidohydrolase family protein n=1 Tax=Microbacterium sp. 4R-513 TaxID=2567934 RepID=UPI0013E1AB06|nr:amidohydrolase family protein [Microbacterium sp. 4R-513]QIG39422.1 amidohydrolase family protein [Microbacterium sp. 4R-513]
MSVLDTHVHVWDPTRLTYPWLDGLAALDRPFLPCEYQGAERAIFVQADCLPDQALAEARWVAGLYWPELAGIVAGADLRSPDLEAHLDALGEVGRVVGIRHLLQGEDAARFADPALRRGLRALASRGLTFDACVRHPQLPALVELVEAVPGLRVVLDHIGKSPVAEGISSDAGRQWRIWLRRLSALPDVHVKLSGLPAETDDAPAFFTQADDFIRFAVDAFGPERAMVGSDWPVSEKFGAKVGPEEWIERVRFATGLVGDEWDAIAATTAARFYRVPEQQ